VNHSIEWVKPVINIKSALEDVTNLKDSQISQINLHNVDEQEDEEEQENAPFMIPPRIKMSDAA
jgi:hypothetical protein